MPAHKKVEAHSHHEKATHKKPAHEAAKEKHVEQPMPEPTPVVAEVETTTPIQPVVQQIPEQQPMPQPTTPVINTGVATAPVQTLSMDPVDMNEMGMDQEKAPTPDRSTSRWILIIVVLILMIIAVLGVGFFYLTQYGPASKSTQPLVSPQPAVSVTTTKEPEAPADDQTDTLEKTEDGDDLKSIKKDVDDTDLDGLTKEMTDIEKDLNSTGSGTTR